MPSRIEEQRAKERAQYEAQIHARPMPLDEDPALLTDSGDVVLDPDAAFAGDTVPTSPEELRAFQDLPPPESMPFSKGGRDYYTNGAGKLVSVDAGFDTTEDYPDFKPATAQQVEEHELQKKSGSLGDKLDAFVETGAATLASAGAGAYNQGRFIVKGFPAPDDIVHPEDIAPFAYTDAALDKRKANPNSALAGGIGADIAVQALFRGRGLGAAAARNLVGGYTAAGLDETLTGEPFRPHDVMLYGMANTLFDAVTQVQWGEAMRALGQRGKGAVDASVEAAQREAIKDAGRETNPTRKAALLQNNADAIYQEQQVVLDQALSTIDERVTTAPDRMFTPGMLRRTVSDNALAQGERFAELSRTLDGAAQITEIPALQEAQKRLAEAYGGTGAQMFGALRDAQKILQEGVGSMLADSPLTRDALESLDNTLKDEGLWGRAAKNHADFSTPMAGESPIVKIDDVGAREALDARLEQAAKVASQTGDKALASAVKNARSALAEADKVTGARLLGPVQTAILGKLTNAAKGAVSAHAGKLVGGLAGGMFGGLPGALVGTIAGDIAGHIATPYIERAAGRLEQLGMQRARRLSPEARRLGQSWSQRIWNSAKDAAKKNPEKLAGAALLGASALTDDDQQAAGTAAASAGLLVFFLPPGGRARLAEELGERLSNLTARERFNLRQATERTSGDVEHLLRRFAAGDREATHGAFRDVEEVLGEGHQPRMRSQSTMSMESPAEVLDNQHTIALARYAQLARIPVEEVPEAVSKALEAELRARNAALIENDSKLLRLAKPGRLELLPRPAEHYQNPSAEWPGSAATERAEASLQEGDMPPQARSHLDRVRDTLRSNMALEVDPTNAAASQNAVYEALGSFQRDFRRAVGREPNARETAFAEAELNRAGERQGLQERSQGAAARRDNMHAVEPGSAEANPSPLTGSSRSMFENWRLRMNDALDAARRGDVPSREQLEQNPRKFFEEWQRQAYVTGNHNAAARDWAQQRLVDPVYEYLGRGPTVGEQLPRSVRELAQSYRGLQESNPREARQSAEGFFTGWKQSAEQTLGRELTPEEEAWGRKQTVDFEPRLSVEQGRGKGARGADAEFRRVGLPEPTQGEVRIDTPMQQKEFPFAREGQIPRIEGEPIRNVGDPTLERRVAKLEQRVQAMPPEAFPVEAQTEFRGIERDIRRFGNYRQATDARLVESAAAHAEAVSRRHAERTGQPLDPKVQELMRARFERDMRAVRAEQQLRQPLTASERSDMAWDALREGDMPAKLQSHLGDARRRLLDGIQHDTKPEEIQRGIQAVLEEMQDRFIVEKNRSPNPRERAYMEANLSHEAADKLEAVTRDHDYRLEQERARTEREQRYEQERVARVQAAKRERARVEEMMGALDHFENNPDEAERLMREYETTRDELRQKGASEDTSPTAVFGAMEARRGKALTDGEVVFLHDQIGTEAPKVRDMMHEAVDEIARNDESTFNDGIPDLDFDDVMEQIEREHGELDPWEEWHVRSAWEDDSRTFERSFENQIQERHDEQKREWKKEVEREREEEYGGGGYYSSDDVPGLPDAADLRRAGIDQVVVNDPRGVQNVFGDLSVADVEGLTAAEPLNELGATLKLKVNRHDVEFEARGGGVTMDRTYTDGDDGLEVSHDQFFLAGPQQGSGTMKKVFRAMFPAYERLGFKRAFVSCAEIGRYLWPSLGFKASPEVEQRAIREFLGNAFVRELPAEAQHRLASELKTLRDVADATVPVHLLEHEMDAMNSEYRGAVRYPGDFKKFFVEDGDLKLGKLFLITESGPWNHHLQLDIDRGSDWYREFLSRIGLMSASGLGLHELMQAFKEDKHTLQTDQDIDRAQPSEVQQEIGASAEEQLRVDQSREKLTYVQEQAKSATTETARALVSPTQKLRQVTIAPGLTQSAGVAAFAGPHDNLRSAYNEKLQTLRTIARDPMTLVNEMADKLAEVSDAAPQAHAQVVAKTYQILNFIQAKIPSTIGVSLMRPEGTPPSDFALRQFALYYSAATNPSTVLTDLANNRARKEQVETLREVWPEVYQSTKVALLETLSEATTKTRPSFNQRARLDLLFDFGPALDGAFSPRITTIAQNAQPDAAQKAPGASVPGRMTQPSITGSSALSPLYKGAAGIAAA